MSEPQGRRVGRVLAALFVAGAGLAAYLGWPLYQQAQQLQHLVAAGWGDSKYGKAFYGARVYYVEEGPQVRVWLAVQIDRGSVWTHYSHDPRLLGVASSPADAVAKWGQLSWTDQGLRVTSQPGHSPAQSYLFPIAELETHR